MQARIARTGTCKAILVLLLMVSGGGTAADFGTISGDEPDGGSRWSANGGSTVFRFDRDLTEELRIVVKAPAHQLNSQAPNEFEFAIRGKPSLIVWAPWGAFDGFAGGELKHSGGLSLSWPGGRLDIEEFSLVPDSPDSLALLDNSGNHLFRLNYIHAMLYPDKKRMTLLNMDLRLSAWLAEQMGYPDLADFVIGGAFSRTNLEIPEGAYRGNQVCGPPSWDNGADVYTDVELSNLGGIQQVARQAGVRVAIAPAATLRNVGTADVPWYVKFTTEPPAEFDDYPEPYSRDQHPILVWAMYRIVDDIPQQIGQSAAKHAFFSTNTTCDCAGGNILWSGETSPDGLGCGDTYSVSNNDNDLHLGIREEVPAFTGAWEQCGSMFAPGASPPGPCTQTVSGNTADSFERRLVVEESELQTANATYYFEGWYVIRDDVNIFNTMAHKSVTPTFGSTWTFPAGAHTQGPAIDAWVPPDTQGAMQAHTVESTSDGHYSLAVKVTDLGKGNYRYVYALMNHDFDPRFDSFSLAVPNGVTLSNVQFLDGDSNGANDWTHSEENGLLTWTSPGGAELEWGFMATFVFEADQAPIESDVALSAFEQPLEFNPVVLGLIPFGNLFRNGFEQ